MNDLEMVDHKGGRELFYRLQLYSFDLQDSLPTEEEKEGDNSRRDTEVEGVVAVVEVGDKRITILSGNHYW